jgi:hypothetical protein
MGKVFVKLLGGATGTVTLAMNIVFHQNFSAKARNLRAGVV